MSKYTAFRCPEDLLEKARARAQKDRRSLSNYLITLIERDVSSDPTLASVPAKKSVSPALTGEVPDEVLTRESDGSISGMTDVSWYPYRRKMLEQQFTGVRPDARGRGLGKWIKAAMLLHVRDLYPDAEWVVTENAESNGPMLKINRTMGFKSYRTAVEYQTTRDQMESRIRSV